MDVLLLREQPELVPVHLPAARERVENVQADRRHVTTLAREVELAR